MNNPPTKVAVVLSSKIISRFDPLLTDNCWDTHAFGHIQRLQAQEGVGGLTKETT